MEKKFTAEEVAQIIMNDAEENEDNEGESSVTSFQSTSDDESVAEEPSSESEVETKEDGDISSTSFISSRVSSNVFMSVGQSKRPRMRGPRVRGVNRGMFLTSFQSEMDNLGLTSTSDMDTSDNSATSISGQLQNIVRPSLPIDFSTTLRICPPINTSQPCTSSPILPLSSHSAIPSTSKRKQAQNSATGIAYQWESSSKPATIFPFTPTPGIKVDMPRDATPYDFFRLFYTDAFIQLIVNETNIYANQGINASRPLRRRCMLNLWVPTTTDEMNKFFGIIFYMGLVALPSYKHYWKSDGNYRNSFVPKIMKRDRFCAIMRFMHFGNNEEIFNDRLGKVRFLISHLDNIMRLIYVPVDRLSLDESMMLWRGRLIFRQYIKNKRHKYGIKFYELCQFDGLVFRICIQSGVAFDDVNDLGQTGAVVLHLPDDFLDKGYTLFVDNFYNSIPLSKYMTTRSTYICGTLNKRRKGIPLKSRMQS